MSDGLQTTLLTILLLIVTEFLRHYWGRQKQSLEERKMGADLVASATGITGTMIGQIKELQAQVRDQWTTIDTMRDQAEAETKAHAQALADMAAKVDQVQIISLQRDEARRERDKAIKERDEAIRLRAQDHKRIAELERTVADLDEKIRQLQHQLDMAQADRSS